MIDASQYGGLCRRKYEETVLTQVEVAQKLYGIYKTIEVVNKKAPNFDKSGIDVNLLNINYENNDFLNLLVKEFDRVKMNLDPFNW
jgi:methylmalonyl-CoA mutase